MAIFISNFNIGVADWIQVSALGTFQVDITVSSGSVDTTSSGSYFLHNDEQVPTTFSGIPGGQRMFYTPASVVSSGTFTITAHAKDSYGSIQEKDFYLLYGYNIKFDQIVEWGPNKQIDVLLNASNAVTCPNLEGAAYYFKTADYIHSDLGAIIRVIEPVDLGATIYTQSTAFYYGKTYTITVSGVRDFSNNIMDPYTLTFTIEDPTS